MYGATSETERRGERNRALTLVFVTAFLFLALSATTAVSAQQQARDEAVEVSDVGDLQNISEDLNGSYVLVDDIDATGTEDLNDGKGFEPIGACAEFRTESISCAETPFRGTLDGNGHTVTGLTINRPDENETGLFGVIRNGTVRDIELEDVEIVGGDFARVGGVAGLNLGRIHEVEISGSVEGENFNAGGVAGSNAGFVNRSSADVKVSGGAAVGGLVGNNGLGGEIRQSYAEGEVTAEQRAGGLSGKNTGRVAHSYATGEVTTEQGQAGGLVGANQNEGEIVGSYAVGTTEGSSPTGGLVGRLGGGTEGDIGAEAPQREGEVASVRDSYWDTEATSHDEGIGKEAPGPGNVTVENVEGLTTEEMQGESPTGTMEAFDFVEVWGTVVDPDGYPRHLWSIQEGKTGNGGSDGSSRTGTDDVSDNQTAEDENDEGNEGMPGFGVVGFLTALFAGGLIRKRRR